MVDISHPFALYAKCNVTYDGRGRSSLKAGNYLVIYKADQSVSVHAKDLIKPRNYMASCVLTLDGNMLRAHRQRETITIQIEAVIWQQRIDDWSGESVEMFRTEHNLVEKLNSNLSQYLGFNPDTVELEATTPVGRIDILATRGPESHIIEAKRRRIGIKDCTQVARYKAELAKGGKDVYAYLAGPSVGAIASRYCREHGIRVIKIEP